MLSSSVLVSAAFAGAVAIGVTVAIERWGGRVGGLFGTLPSTVIPAAIGIAAQHVDPTPFRQAMYALPAGMLVNALFLYLWRVVPPWLPAWRLGQRLALMITIAMGGWAVAALGSVLALGALRSSGLPLWLPAVAITICTVALGAWACRRSPPAPRGLRRVGPATLLARGLLAGAAIGTAMFLAGAGGALAAGMAAVFPAIFLTTMVSLWLSQGEAVQAGAVGPMMLGSGSVSTYALLATWALPALGPALGSLVSWLGAAVLVTVPGWLWLRHVSRPEGGAGAA